MNINGTGFVRLRQVSTGCCVTALLVVAACDRVPAGQPAALLPDILIVLPGAEDVKYFSDSDGAVTYRLAVPHPALATIQAIRGRLEPAGWTPTKEDFLNPALTNSHDRGWWDYIDGTKNDDRVFAWSGDWTSSRGDIVRYGFTYRYPKDQGPMDARPPLEVSALYMTAMTVNRIRSASPQRQ